jgi:F-type H+-transporting ATPase subunit a
MNWLLAIQASPHRGSEEGSLEAGSWLDFLPHIPGWPKWLPVVEVWALGAMLFLALLCYLGTRRMQRSPKGLQNLLEMAVQSLENFAVGIIGPAGKSFTPLLGTLFIYIAIMNLMGLIPGFSSPTANLNITLAMAIVVFFTVQYHGIRQGKLGYFKHFIGEPWWLFPLMLPLHIITEFVRPMTLALRLYGNIRGEDIAILSFIGLAATLPIFLRWLPLQFPLLALACLTSLIQALIFTLLSAVYLALASPEHEH